jgi:hypothetical protein
MSSNYARKKDARHEWHLIKAGVVGFSHAPKQAKRATERGPPSPQQVVRVQRALNRAACRKHGDVRCRESSLPKRSGWVLRRAADSEVRAPRNASRQAVNFTITLLNQVPFMPDIL